MLNVKHQQQISNLNNYAFSVINSKFLLCSVRICETLILMLCRDQYILIISDLIHAALCFSIAFQCALSNMDAGCLGLEPPCIWIPQFLLSLSCCFISAEIRLASQQWHCFVFLHRYITKLSASRDVQTDFPWLENAGERLLLGEDVRYVWNVYLYSRLHYHSAFMLWLTVAAEISNKYQHGNMFASRLQTFKRRV